MRSFVSAIAISIASITLLACASSSDPAPTKDVAPAAAESVPLVVKDHPDFVVGHYDAATKTAVFNEASDPKSTASAGLMFEGQRVGTISPSSLSVVLPAGAAPGTSFSVAPDQPGAKPFEIALLDVNQSASHPANIAGCDSQGGTSVCKDWEIFLIWLYCAERVCCISGVGCF